MRQFRVSLSARNNKQRTSRGNTKSGVVGMWKSGKCHWCTSREGEESEAVFKVGVRHWQGSVSLERVRGRAMQ